MGIFLAILVPPIEWDTDSFYWSVAWKQGLCLKACRAVSKVKFWPDCNFLLSWIQNPCELCGQPYVLLLHGRSSGHRRYFYSNVCFFFFSRLLLEKLWPTYSSKLFCYIRVIQSNYVTLIAKAFSCSVSWRPQTAGPGGWEGEIMVASEIRDAGQPPLVCLLTWMAWGCVISVLLESKCLHSF